MSILTQALDTCPTAFIIINSQGLIVETNKATAKIFGYQKDELIGNEIEMLLLDDFHTKHKKNVSDFFNNPISRSLGSGRVLVGKNKNGTQIFVEIGISFFEDKGEKFGVANIVDVTKEHHLKRLLERTQEVAKIGSWQVDLRDNKCYWSKMTYQIHELDESQEVFVEDGINFYAEEHRDIIKACVERGINEREPWDVELKILTTTGKEKWVHALGTPVVVDDEVVSLEGTFQDIHERKLLEIENELNLFRLQRTEKISKVGHWELALDPPSIRWSEGLYDIWEVDKDQPPPSLEEHAKNIHEEDREHFFSTIEHAIQTKTPYSVEFRFVSEKGEKHIHGEGSPVLDDWGELTGFFGVALDLTLIKKQEKEQELLLWRHSLALESSNIGVWDWNLLTNELIWDQRMYKLYGIREKDFEGAFNAWEKGLHPDDRERSVEEIQGAIKMGKKFDTTFRVLWPNGEVKHIKALADIVKDKYGKPIKVIGVNLDITENYKQKRKLELANDELAQFAYRTSHDLKAPLIRIKGLANASLEELEDNELEQGKAFLRQISNQSEQLESLINDILNLSRADFEEQKREIVDLNEIVEKVIGRTSYMAEEKNVVINYDVQGLKDVYASKTRLTQVVENLVSNAIKYSDPSKTERFVKIRGEKNNYYDFICVEDNGLGIPLQNQKNVFEMFQRFHPKVASGSGLGMYIVKKHVEKLEGQISFSSSENGTSFLIKLPSNRSH